MADPVILVNPLEEQERARRRGLMVIRAVYLIMLITVVMLIILRIGSEGLSAAEGERVIIEWWWVPVVVSLVLGGLAIFFDALTPNKKLSSMTAALFGLIAGLLATVAISWLIEFLLEAHGITFREDDIPNRIMFAIKAAVGITLCYLGVSVVYSSQDEFRLIIPYVEFSKQLRGSRPLVLDTSAIIDGRINDIGSTGFVSMPVIIPRFVIHELQALSDSGDKMKRNRGRRGLDIIRKMQNNPHLDISITEARGPVGGVDQMLLEMAREHQAHLVTTDFNLNKVASIHGVKVLNINDLANALKPSAVPGEVMRVEIVKRGEGDTQGVGYLADGTMVVVEQAVDLIGDEVEFTVTSAIQTSAGRMIFGERIGPSGPATIAGSGTGTAARGNGGVGGGRGGDGAGRGGGDSAGQPTSSTAARGTGATRATTATAGDGATSPRRGPETSAAAADGAARKTVAVAAPDDEEEAEDVDDSDVEGDGGSDLAADAEIAADDGTGGDGALTGSGAGSATGAGAGSGSAGGPRGPRAGGGGSGGGGRSGRRRPPSPRNPRRHS